MGTVNNRKHNRQYNCLPINKYKEIEKPAFR